jgi:tRNA threonylcarbamoyl adenosine modification protein YeaZ
MTADGRPVIALEASTSLVSCSIHGEFDVDVSTLAAARQVELFPEIVVRALAAARITVSELGMVVVGAGPGSYIGLRSGLAFGNALSHAVGCPIAGVSTLDSIAIDIARDGRLAVVALEAGRDRLNVAAYRSAGAAVDRHLEPCLMSHAELDRYVAACPEPVDVYRPRVAGTPAPTARGHLKIALLRPDWLAVAPPGGAVPVYSLPAAAEPVRPPSPLPGA